MLQKIKYYIPSYEEAQLIVSSNEQMVFYETKHVVEGYNISTFNYKLASWKNFKTPIESNPEIDGYELRGITYVFNSDNSLFKRYLLLNKFWNVNQTEETMESDLKNLTIKNVTNKEDGSLISFVMLPNEKIVPRTQNSFFDKDYTILADVRKLYKSDTALQNFIKYCLENDIAPMFEFTHFSNKIILEYDEAKLTLLKLRNNLTGEYLDVNDFHKYDIDIVKTEDISFQEMILLRETVEKKEGWVIEFENSLLVKIKTRWYFNRFVVKESADRENELIAMVCDQTIDDVMSFVDKDFIEKRQFIENIIDIVNKFISKRLIDINYMIDNDFKGDIKLFAIQYKNHPLFYCCMWVINKRGDLIEKIKEDLKKNTHHLQKAREWLKSQN